MRARLLESLDELEQQRFSIMAGAIREAHDDALADHALYGVHLDTKLELVDRAVRELEREEQRRLTTRKRRVSRWGWVLKTFNVLLGSISAVVPPVGAAKELKEAAEAALDENGTFRERLRGAASSVRRIVGFRREGPEELRPL